MDDRHCYQFFQEPSDLMQRRYEVLRAVFVDDLSQRQAAERFGFTHGALRNLIHDFRAACRNGSPPPFSFRSDEDGQPQATTRVSMKS
ncbi:MAG: helix-turn-helix domain-containing protein [Planctomycetes bacterium]|nr:helix-turn-helix domain-containing protein [Planctomycetota bacterium]